MQSLLLCHECFDWVEPSNGHCPQCLSVVDAAAPDPSPDELRRVLGDVLLRLGEVRLLRRRVPDRGLLYATTRGLYFLPHQVRYVEETKQEQVGPSLGWIVAAVFITPVALLLPYLKSKRLRRVDRPVHSPIWLTAEDSLRLPDLLMDNPGALFIPLAGIRHVEQRGRRWHVDRRMGRRVSFECVDTPPLLPQRLRELAALAEWQAVCGEG